MDFKTDKHLPAIFSSDPSAIAAAAAVKARIESAYMMALHKPRNFDQCRTKILEACKRPEFAQEVEFDRIQGKKYNPKTREWEDNHIRGLTIRFTEVALTAWTNILTESQMIYEDDHIRRVRVAVLDLEENVCFSHDIQFTKTVERSKKKGREVVNERLNTYGKTVYVVKATADEIQNKENALVSKTLRNEGNRVVPEDIKREAIAVAKETILKEDAKDPAAAKKKVIDGFANLGIWPKDLEKYLKHSLDVITPVELQGLRAVYTSVKDGEATWHSFIEPDEPEEPQAPDDLADRIKNGKPGAAQDLYGGKAPSDTQEPLPDADEAGKQGDETEEAAGHATGTGKIFTIDPLIAQTFTELTDGGDTGVFWRMREKGLGEFFDTFENVMKGWPQPIQDFIYAKCKNIAGKHPEFVGRLNKALEEKPELSDEETTTPDTQYCIGPKGCSYAGKQISYAAVCSVCDKNSRCQEYALYLEFQKQHGETLE